LSARVPLWEKLEVVENLSAHIRLDEDESYYAREYTSVGGYAASEGNNLISNFKIEPRHKERTHEPTIAGEVPHGNFTAI
jgi:hypothetical protein